MAFSIITADPTWGILVTNALVLTPTPAPSAAPLFTGADSVIADLGAVLNLGAVNASGIAKPFAGWITYNSSGGGSTRPTSGMLYPRGQC